MATSENEKGDTASSKEGEAWGTLEELLLACAVCRHGTKSWDSISVEVQKRANSGDRNSQKDDGVFTPQNCEQRYHALKLRFNLTGGGDRNDRAAVDELREKLSFMVDELRKLRVEELRREVERHDVSIVSLQSKVKKLEEEKENKPSSKADQPAVGDADLEDGADRNEADERTARDSAEVADEQEDRSFNESNSTSRRESNQRRGPDSEPDPALPAADFAPEKDCSSSRGGGDGLENEEKVVGRTSQTVRLGNSGELRESVSESKREGKQSSDVQSSASLSRRKRRGWRRSDGGVGSSGEDDMEAEEWSPANKRTDSKSQPLIKFMEMVRSHKHGLVFQRRLPSQETDKYRNLIRQHMDLETVQSNLERGLYCECHPKFYRDILLVFTNAIIFFCKSSTEHAAARDLRKLVMKEIVSSQEVARKPKPVLLAKPDLESQILDPVVKKPRSSTNIVVCRRRTNSSAMKLSSLSSEKNATKSKEAEMKIEMLDTKPSVSKKKVDDEGVKTLTKKTTNSNNNASNNSNNASASNSKKSNKDDSSDEDQPINKRSRKQGVVNFLKRMKQNSPSKEAVAKPSETEERKEDKGKKGEMGKKKAAVVGKKKDSDDGASNRRISGRRTTPGEMETTRRGGGGGGGARPPTRKATTTTESGGVKRRRDGEKDVGSSGKNTAAKKPKR